MSEKILVVDDEKEIADLIEVYLKNDGYTVYKYYNGIDALKCINEQELDLAILDAVSYTHLDVYKRQKQCSVLSQTSLTNIFSKECRVRKSNESVYYWKWF